MYIMLLCDIITKQVRSKKFFKIKHFTEKDETSFVNYTIYLADHFLPITSATLKAFIVEIKER